MSDGDPLPLLMKSSLDALRMEDLLLESMRDLLKEEIKRHIRQKLDEDPRLKAEIRAALSELMEAKAREAYAMVRIGKYGAELGIALVPDEMRKRIERDVAALLEKEMGRMVEEL